MFAKQVSVNGANILAAAIDLEHDRSDLNRKLVCPLHILWGLLGIVGQLFDVLTPWLERAENVSGRSLDCGHYLAEEAPKETLTEIFEFLTI